MLRTPRRTLFPLFVPMLLCAVHGFPLAAALPPGTAPVPAPASAGGSVTPSVPAPLTPEEAVRLALGSDPSLRARRLEAEAATARLVDARRLPDPEVEVELFRPRRADDDGGLRVEAAVGWEVSSLFRLGPLAEAAGADLDAARARTAAAAALRAFEVESAFHGLAAARRKRTAARTRAELAAVGADAAEAVVSAGNAPPLPFLREAARREAAALAFAEAGLAVLEGEERLASLLAGVAGARDAVAGVGSSPPPSLPPAPELAGLEEAAVAASLELAELRARLRAAEARARLATADGRRPGLELRLLVEREEGAWGAGAGVSFRLPLFGRGRGAALEAEARSIREQIAGAEAVVRSSARLAGERLSAARARAERLAGPVREFHDRLVSETLLQANAMQVGIADVLAARDAALRAEADAAEALRDASVAAAAVRAVRAGVRPDAPAFRPGPSTAIAFAEGGH